MLQSQLYQFEIANYSLHFIPLTIRPVLKFLLHLFWVFAIVICQNIANDLRLQGLMSQIS